MKPLVFVLMLALPTNAVAGPIAASVAHAFDTHDPQGHYEEVPAKSSVLVWVGIGLVVIGLTAAIAAATWEQHSDLSQESLNTRLYRDLAPCRSDPDTTILPIADCRLNTPLLMVGLGATAAGGALILYGSQPADNHHPAIRFRVRF